MANNSAVFHRDSVKESEFRRIIRVAEENYGDPGFLFVEDLDYGCNPCGEIGLHPVLWSECNTCKGKGGFHGARSTVTGAIWDDGSGKWTACIDCVGSGKEKKTGFAFCNLTEVNVARCKTKVDFFEACRVASFIGTLQAAYTDFPYLGEVSEKIAQRDALIGVSLTGVMDQPSIGLDPVTLRAGVDIINDTNVDTAECIGILPASRTTTIKPSGTASLELGAIGSGAHAYHAPRHLRRVTGNINEPPVKEFMRVNPHMIERKPDGDVAIVFPVEAPAGAICIGDLTGVEQIQNAILLYENWVRPGTVYDSNSPGLTHNVSYTVTIMPDEKEDVINYIWQNRHSVAAMSFVPGGVDKLYPYAPRESIVTEEDETYWNRLIAGYKPVDWTLFKEGEDTTTRQQEAACSAGGCEE